MLTSEKSCLGSEKFVPPSENFAFLSSNVKTSRYFTSEKFGLGSQKLSLTSEKFGSSSQKFGSDF